MAGTTKRERGSDRKKAAPLKRSKVMGMGVFQDENGFKVLNPGMPSSKICSTGQARVTRSADITGNIDYTPTSTHGADELMTCPSCRTISASSRFNKYSSSGILSLRGLNKQQYGFQELTENMTKALRVLRSKL
ncbi:hypothetical protein T459_11839 [Capsicum annuum]|uniref:Uncharacterized protein n=1 Tax=Capsicum annuum TaxID=4072 RepID=A0A2G2ZN30_CAPAN|nr:hypothetical protein T459_11839 [Capsicum annuum]